MVQSISRSNPKAKKEYKCMALFDVLDHISKEELLNLNCFNDEEREVIRKAVIDDNCRVQIGEVYERQVNVYDGDLYTFIAKIDALKILSKYKLLTEAD